MSSLFPIVYHIAQDVGITIDADEKIFLKKMYASLSTHTALRSTVNTTHTTFQEEHLPLMARCIGRTIGLIDDNGDVVPIPHQWFATQSNEDDLAEVIRKSLDADGNVVYEQDFDDQYIMKYEDYIQKNGGSYSTDSIQLEINDLSSSSSSVQSISQHNLENLVDTQMTRVRFDERFEERFVAIWGAQYAFPDEQQGNYPSIHDDTFRRVLYDTQHLNFSSINQMTMTAQNSHIATFKDHQQLVRNFMSPLTPYHSLLMIHATGTGKTFTTFAITEQFRNTTYAQNKKIHITCPRREICNEFLSYLRSNGNTTPQSVKSYVQTPYQQDVKRAAHDMDRKQTQHYAEDHYRIENYHAIFPKSFYQYINILKRIVHSWYVILPHIHSVRRTDEGFVIETSSLSASEVSVVQKSLDQLSVFYSKELKEVWVYTIDTKMSEHTVNIRVSNTNTLFLFEKKIVREYANTLFVVDEAHRLVDPPLKTNGDVADDYVNRNWRNMLMVVIAILRYHHYRMRLLLLTATPMINSDDDFVVLLNMLIHNDGIQNETPFRVMKTISAHTSEKRRKSQQFLKSIQGRVSYYKNDHGKPKQLFAEDVFYNVPASLTSLHACIGNQFPVLLVESFSEFLRSCRDTPTPYTVWDQRRIEKKKHHIPLDTLAQYDCTTNTQLYVYVLIDATLEQKTMLKWCNICGAHLNAQHTLIVVGLQKNKTYIKTLSNDKEIQHALFSQTSIRHPLLAPSLSHPHTHASIYHTNRHPTIYASSLNNMDTLLNTYMKHSKGDNKHVHTQYNPSVVATAMRNEAVITTDVHKTLKYNITNQIIHNWNVHDNTDTVYHPKIDTMLHIMETLPGNILVYTNEVRLDPKHKKGARALLFLKRKMQTYFSSRPSSRLHNTTVEILHKETLLQMDDNDKTTELNERIQIINNTLLAQRNDVILIGSKEIMEGLTIDEIRQVHLLDPAWNKAQMEQVMGRAIRIGNHKKHTDCQLHNVSCFLHISVPETPFKQLPNVTNTNITSLNPMERAFGDLHRYRLMQHKINDICQTDITLQSNAIDTVFLDVSNQLYTSVLNDNTHQRHTKGVSWNVVKHIQPSYILRDTIESLRKTYVYQAKHHPRAKEQPLYPASSTMRNEIDWLKACIPHVFINHNTRFQTFHEICQRVQPAGRISDVSHTRVPVVLRFDVDYYRHLLHKHAPHLACVTCDDILTHIHSFSPLIQQQIFLTVLLLQYKWHTTADPNDATVVRLHIDECSVLTHPDWREHRRAAESPTSLTEWMEQRTLETRVRTLLQTLLIEYTISKSPNSSKYTEPSTDSLKQHRVFGVCVQDVRPSALENALYELISNKTTFQMNDHCYYMGYASPFYILVPHHLPTPVALWNVAVTEISGEEPLNYTPYSVVLGDEKELTADYANSVLNDILESTKHIVTGWKTLIPISLLETYIMEYAFDSMMLRDQERFLHYIAIYGLDALVTDENRVSVAVFRKCLEERFVEKGSKQNELFPQRAQHILTECFPNHAGRLFITFPKNPALETCAVHAYEHRGKKTTTAYTKKSISVRHSIYTQLVYFFSPIPIRNSSNKEVFYASPDVHNVSTLPIQKTTPIFGYNEVLNFKNKSAHRFQQKICVSNHQRDVPLDSSDVLDALEDFHAQQQERSFPTTVDNAEKALFNVCNTRSNTHVQLNALLCCRFVLLRHANVFLRFFYPGIVSKHPNKEYYASYKHVVKKKWL